MTHLSGVFSPRVLLVLFAVCVVLLLALLFLGHSHPGGIAQSSAAILD